MSISSPMILCQWKSYGKRQQVLQPFYDLVMLLDFIVSNDSRFIVVVCQTLCRAESRSNCCPNIWFIIFCIIQQKFMSYITTSQVTSNFPLSFLERRLETFCIQTFGLHKVAWHLNILFINWNCLDKHTSHWSWGMHTGRRNRNSWSCLFQKTPSNVNHPCYFSNRCPPANYPRSPPKYMVGVF